MRRREPNEQHTELGLNSMLSEENEPRTITLHPHKRLPIANAITAILLHVEAINQNAQSIQLPISNIIASSEEIKESAKRIWHLLEQVEDELGF